MVLYENRDSIKLGYKCDLALNKTKSVKDIQVKYNSENYIAWLENMGYFNNTAKILLLSKSFFNWWYVQVSLIETQLINSGCKITLKLYKKAVLSINTYPCNPLFSKIKKESNSLLKKNKKLATIKFL